MTDEKNSHNQAVERFTYRGKCYSLLPPAIILARKHRWLWPYRSRRAALRARQRGQAFAIAVCGHVVAKNQPLVVTGITHDPRFAGSPFLKQHRFRFYAGVPLPAPNAPGIQSGLLP
jgi:GAF domain-containing protein